MRISDWSSDVCSSDLRIAETFVRSFAPAIAGAGTRNEGTGEDEADWLDPDAADPPDLLEDDRIDAGEVVAEELALALDPYPRKAGVDLPPEYHSKQEHAAKDNPFDVLAGRETGKK